MNKAAVKLQVSVTQKYTDTIKLRKCLMHTKVREFAKNELINKYFFRKNGNLHREDTFWKITILKEIFCKKSLLDL